MAFLNDEENIHVRMEKKLFFCPTIATKQQHSKHLYRNFLLFAKMHFCEFKNEFELDGKFFWLIRKINQFMDKFFNSAHMKFTHELVGQEANELTIEEEVLLCWINKSVF